MNADEAALPMALSEPAHEMVPAKPRRALGGHLGRDVAITLLTQAAVAIGGLFIYRLIALHKGADGVAAYALVKQLTSGAWVITMIGLQTAIPRYVALARDRKGAAELYLLAAVVLTGTVTVATCLAALVSPHFTAALFLGDRNRDGLVIPFAATLLATVLINVAYGYFRGLSDFVIGNAVRIVALSIFPVTVLLVAHSEPIGSLINLMAVLTVIPCLAVLAAPLTRAVRNFHPHEARVAGGELVNYGSRRIVGDLASAGLFTVPPILASHFVDLKGVAYLSAGMYMLSMMTLVFQPVGLVFLPLLSRLCATDFEAARRAVRVLVTAAIHIAAFITPQLILFASTAVRAWLGPSFVDAGTIITITVCPAGIFVFNILLRSALDAAAVTAYNSRNNVASLAVAGSCVTVALVAGFGDPLICIAWSLTIGLSLFGLLTLVSVHRLFRLHVSDYAVVQALGLVLASVAIALPIRLLVIGDSTSLTSVALVGALEAVLATLYIAGLSRMGIVWPGAIFERMRGAA